MVSQTSGKMSAFLFWVTDRKIACSYLSYIHLHDAVHEYVLAINAFTRPCDLVE